MDHERPMLNWRFVDGNVEGTPKFTGKSPSGKAKRLLLYKRQEKELSAIISHQEWENSGCKTDNDASSRSSDPSYG